MKNSKILKDYIYINNVLNLNKPAYKQAGFMSDITNWVTKFVSDQIDTTNTTTTVASIIPLVLSVLLAFITGPLGFILPFLTSVFSIEIKNLIIQIVNALESEFKKIDDSKGEYQPSEEHIHSITKDVVNSAVPSEPTKESKNDNINLIIFKKAVLGGAAAKVATPVAKSFFIRAISFVINLVIKIVKGSTLYVAGDATNAIIDRPSSIGNTKSEGKPISVITKYKLKKFVENQSTPWAISIPNNLSNIQDLLVSIVQEVYDGLDNQDSKIKSTPSLISLSKDIEKYNHLSAGTNIVIMPKSLNKKKIADMIIMDL